MGHVVLGGVYSDLNANAGITNTINGNVTMNGAGHLRFISESGTSNGFTYTTINTINGTVSLNGGSDSLVKGAHNSISDGLILNTTTNDPSYKPGGGNEHNDTTDAVIGGGDDATIAANPNLVNTLTLGTDGSGLLTITANPNSSTQRDEVHGYGFQPGGNGQEADRGYDIDSGHLLVGAFTDNTAGSAQSITNTLEGNVLLNGGVASDNSLTGGMVVLGASGHNLSDGGTVTNQITGTVKLNGGSRLYLGGDKIDPDANGETTVGDGTGSVTNKVEGAVTAKGNGYVAMWGEQDPNAMDSTNRLHNIIGAGVSGNYGLTLNDNGYFRVEGLDNTVGGNGTELNDHSIAQLGGSGGTHLLESNMHGSYTLNNFSQLRLGATVEFLAQNDITNCVYGSVNANGASALKVLSGGSGGIHSSDGSSIITGGLDFTSDIDGTPTLEVNLNHDVSTGVFVGQYGNVALNGATLNVADTDLNMNLLNGYADPNNSAQVSDFTFGRHYSLIGVGYGGISASEFGGVQLLDSSGQYVLAPSALALTPGYNHHDNAVHSDDPDAVYLDILTDFHDVAQTTNQRNFGQYLDNLVANSSPDGISDTTATNDLHDLLNKLVWQGNLNTYNHYLGDSYAAFDMTGYWNANRFVNTIATHARQSHDSDWTETFALNAQRGISGVGSQMSLVKQLLNTRPTLNLAGDNNHGNDSALWGSISGDWLRNSGDSHLGSPDWNLNSKSVVIGYQGGSDSFSWGINGGYHDGNLDFNNRDASGDNDGWSAGLNGLWQSKNHVYVNGVLSYNRDSNSLTRNDGFGTNKSDFNAKSISALLEVGKRIDKKSFNFTPYASLLGVKYDRDGANEHGTGVGLDIDSESHSYLTSSLGVRIGRDYLDKSGQKRGGLMAGASWQHQFSSTDFTIRASLQSAPGGTGYTIYGTPLSSDSLGVQLDAYGRLAKDLFGFLNYSGNFSGNQKINSITAGL